MAQQTDDTRGFPRLPFDPTPPPDLVARAMAGAQEDPAAAMQRVVALMVQHMGLQRRNDDFAARFWGAADVSENTAEHWQYLRNADFSQGTNGSYKWPANAALVRLTSTSSLPYNAKRAMILSDTSGSENWAQQSCSAQGGTWYVASGWIQWTSGPYGCIKVVENSGSSSARTHAICTNSGPWKYIEIPFKTYKGTTRLTYRLVVAANSGLAFTLPMLEKGRRGHPWRPSLIDRGVVTSLKTAGSASFIGNITLSRGGAIKLRQKATRTFVISSSTLASASSATPKPVSATAAVGTATTYARGDHVHPGVRSLRTAGSASFDGRLQLSGSGAVRFRQVTGKFIASTTGLVSLSSTTPAQVSATGAVGVGTTAARADHAHKGVTSIFKSGGASADGRVGVVQSGDARVQVLGSNLRIYAYPSAGSGIEDVSSSNYAGVWAARARGDHVHKGLRSMRTAGSASYFGNLVVSGAGAVRIRQVAGLPRKFIWSTTGLLTVASTTPVQVSTSGTVGVGTTAARSDHRHRGVPAIRIRGAQGSASGTVRFSQSSNVTLRRSGSTVIVGATGGSGSGASVQTAIPGGRLTLTSGTSVTTADVTAAGTIYYAIHTNNRIALYSGSAWAEHTFTERSLALTLTSGKNYDVFLYDNAGTLTLELSAAWTNDTTRADALTTQDGVLVKSGATTRRYLGTIRASAANVTEDSLAKRFCWNAYNRVERDVKIVDATNSWTYTTASYHQANASAANQVEAVFGLAIDPVFLSVKAGAFNSGGNVNIGVGVGVDSTTVNSARVYPGFTVGGNVAVCAFSDYSGTPGIGYHYFAWLEISTASGTTTWYGDNGQTYVQSGMSGKVMA